MQKTGSFLIIEPDETVKMSLQLRTIKTCLKHFHQEQHRSFLCSGQDCRFDHQQNPPRIRYQANVIVNSENLRWEFGEQVYNQLHDFEQIEGYVNIKVTRLGSGSRTEYHVQDYDPELPPTAPLNVFKCRLCHKYIFPVHFYDPSIPQCTCRASPTSPTPKTASS